MFILLLPFPVVTLDIEGLPFYVSTPDGVGLVGASPVNLAGQAPPLRFTRAIPNVVVLCLLEWELRWGLGKPGSELQIGLLPGRCGQRPYSTECGPVRRLLRISIAD